MMKYLSLVCSTIFSFFIFSFYTFFIGALPPYIFAICSCLMFISFPPKYLLSPRTIVFAFYFLWYGIGVTFAQRYNSYTFSTQAEINSFWMVFICFTVFYWSLSFFEDKKFTKKFTS